MEPKTLVAYCMRLQPAQHTIWDLPPFKVIFLKVSLAPHLEQLAGNLSVKQEEALGLTDHAWECGEKISR